MPLSDISKLTVEICEQLGIPYRYGEGYATIGGKPLNEIPYEAPFPENYVLDYQIARDSTDNSKGCYMPVERTNEKTSSVIQGDYMANISVIASLVA